MTVRAVTFDCAQTLIDVDWRPAVLAVECAQHLGFDVDETGHAAVYDRLLRSRWGEFRELNLTRDANLTDAFWDKLTSDWCQECGYPQGSTVKVLHEARERLFGPASTVFRLYDDVVPCLEALARSGVVLAVVSNWDISLHRVIDAFGLRPFFATVVASMEEGVEKPDPRIFETALQRIGMDAAAAWHVGDNPVDDFQGARGAGMKAVLVDRSSSDSSGAYVSTLTDVPERIGL
ncbi:MAG: HAD-IA family hydrolase [Armatimonadetes bacterium]|nr:HAD-IA family hydrolase [Armatimonadota bacterium]